MRYFLYAKRLPGAEPPAGPPKIKFCSNFMYQSQNLVITCPTLKYLVLALQNLPEPLTRIISNLICLIPNATIFIRIDRASSKLWSIFKNFGTNLSEPIWITFRPDDHIILLYEKGILRLYKPCALFLMGEAPSRRWAPGRAAKIKFRSIFMYQSEILRKHARPWVALFSSYKIFLDLSLWEFQTSYI